MAWIKVTDDASWTGKLRDLRPQTVDPTTGTVDNIMAIHSLDAGSLQAHLAIYRQAMKPTPSLSKSDREMIALLVSQLNQCHY